MNQAILEKINLKVLSLSVATLSFSSVGLALVSQYMFNMQPCAWCILQRIIFIIIGLVALGSIFITKKKALFLFWISIELLTSLGMVAALYQFLVASKSFECGVSLAEKIINMSHLDQILPSIFAVMGLCGEASYILGIPYVIFALLLFMFISSISTLSIIKLFRAN